MAADRGDVAAPLRHRALVSPAADAVPRGRTSHHDPRFELSVASRTDPRGNPPRLPKARARTRAARGRDHRAVRLYRRRGRATPRRDGGPDRGLPAWRARLDAAIDAAERRIR